MEDRRKCDALYCEVYNILFSVPKETLKEEKDSLTYKFLNSEVKLKGKYRIKMIGNFETFF